MNKLKYLGYVVSLVFLILTFRGVDYLAILDNLAYINIPYLAIAVLVNFLFFTFRAWYQNSNLYYLNNSIPFRDSLTAIAKAQFYNVFLPGRVGEVLRVFFCLKEQALARPGFFPMSSSKKSSILPSLFCCSS